MVVALVCVILIAMYVSYMCNLWAPYYPIPETLHSAAEATGCTEYENVSLTRDVIVRSVYFDGRHRDGHKNASVFLVEVRMTILEEKGIVGCAVGGHVGTDFKILPLKLNVGWVHKHLPELTHDTIMVNCFDLPVQNGSAAYIMYRKHINESAVVTCVYSEYPLILPAPPGNANPKWGFTVAVCAAMTYGRPPLFTEWLQYQKALSVDHVHIMAEDSFVTSVVVENEALKLAIEEGYVSVDVWKPWLNQRQVFYHSQALAHEACLYRLLGVYSYIMLVDLDEFFIPRVPGQKALHYYAQKCCRYGTSCGSCLFREFMYFPDCGLNGTVDEDGNITAKLVSYVNVEQPAVGKSIHIPAAILDVGCQRAEVFVKGYRRSWFPMEQAYVAHIRRGRKPPDGKC